MDSLSLYHFVRSSPIILQDESGLESAPPGSQKNPITIHSFDQAAEYALGWLPDEKLDKKSKTGRAFDFHIYQHSRKKMTYYHYEPSPTNSEGTGNRNNDEDGTPGASKGSSDGSRTGKEGSKGYSNKEDANWATAVDLIVHVVSIFKLEKSESNEGKSGGVPGGSGWLRGKSLQALWLAVAMVTALKPKRNPSELGTLVGKSPRQMRRAAGKRLSEIAKDKNNPLRGWAEKLTTKKGALKKLPTRGHHNLANRPDIVEMAHVESQWLTGNKGPVVLSTAWYNQMWNETLEKGRRAAIGSLEAVDIGGIAVELGSATWWETIGWLPKGTVANAPRLKF
jgi:hypothetical protein